MDFKEYSDKPMPIETMTKIEQQPIMTPSIVRRVRDLRRFKFCKAQERISLSFMIVLIL
jgi:hypothetical protein